MSSDYNVTDLEMLRAALDSSHDGIHILDTHGNTVFINETCCRIEGVDKDEVYKKSIQELIKDGVYSESVTVKVLEEKKTISLMQTAPNGRSLLVTGTPIYKNGEIETVIVNSRDITELNSLREDLADASRNAKRYREELEVLRREHLKNALVVSNSVAMQTVLKHAATVADVDSTILITGESGVGKGMVARYVHNASKRKNGPFITIDCSAIPENLFESELFGYEKGAFTGAEKSGKTGLLELANGGTVFLDEIGDMPLVLQAKLMRVIQEKTVLPVGGSEYRKIDVRYISATNKNLEKLVDEEKFRKDLLYRLKVFPIEIPPLRDRKDDILPLIISICEKINMEYGWNKHFDSAAIHRLMSYSWPGNVRELENVVERLFISSTDEIVQASEIKNGVATDTVAGDLSVCPLNEEEYKGLLAQYDMAIINNLIEEEGSIAKAAQRINVYPTTLRRKIERYKSRQK